MQHYVIQILRLMVDVWVANGPRINFVPCNVHLEARPRNYTEIPCSCMCGTFFPVNSTLMVFPVTVVFIYHEVGECSLNKYSLTFPSIYTPSKEYARETVPTILLSTVDQLVVLCQVPMQKATATFMWKLVIDSGTEMVAIKICTSHCLSKHFFP